MVRCTSDLLRAECPPPDVIVKENEIALERAKPSKNPTADRLAWTKTKVKFQKSQMLGPFYAFGDLPVWPDACVIPRLLNGFGLLKMRGGATHESCRVIDDGKARGHNADSDNTATHRPADLDREATLARTIAVEFPKRPVSGFPSDFKSASRKVPADPGQALDFAIASRDVDLCKRVFFSAMTQSFGSGNVPLSWTRILDCCFPRGTLCALCDPGFPLC